ncbi:MFS family permease [Geodermatophilus bullaregiensis]|uniref:MFS transporter n=1 Tax=Geodermatophilus bullaregiensis TaxID=1564160 RepID=UPI0019587885|nr:MFS transporter [Geodermatophilus bullaregiensis]MBM7808495.1 MFS family permease [Geodermatophilus bullaregiensis]
MASRRFPLLGLIGAACSLVAVFAASGSPIPLYETYRRADGLTTGDLALTAVAYFAGAMLALLTLGRLSNHLGRRPVTLAALALAAAGCLVLVEVHGTATLVTGRVLQGLACGLASSAVAAYVVDTAPPTPRWLAAAVTAGAPMIGLTVGAIGSGALAEYGPAPRTLAYLLAAPMLAACAVLVAVGPETAARTPGVAASLRPQVRVPPGARRFLPVAAATFVATWALGGFYQAFGPTVAADQLGTTNALVAAAVFASLMAPSAVGGPLAGRLAPATAQRAGMVVYLLAVAVILTSLRLGTVLPFLVASAVAGAAQGATMTGSMRALLMRTGPADRAGLLAAVYLISYSGAAIPGLVAGQLSSSLDLFTIAVGYGVLAALACVLTLATARNPAPLPQAELSARAVVTDLLSAPREGRPDTRHQTASFRSPSTFVPNPPPRDHGSRTTASPAERRSRQSTRVYPS